MIVVLFVMYAVALLREPDIFPVKRQRSRLQQERCDVCYRGLNPHVLDSWGVSRANP